MALLEFHDPCWSGSLFACSGLLISVPGPRIFRWAGLTKPWVDHVLKGLVADMNRTGKGMIE
jgi:hypothetical protein